jgi:hypothetical protein
MTYWVNIRTNPYLCHKIEKMSTSVIQPPLTNLQMELLKLFSRQISESDLRAIRDLISAYLLEKTFQQADLDWAEKGYSAESFKAAIEDGK